MNSLVERFSRLFAERGFHPGRVGLVERFAKAFERAGWPRESYAKKKSAAGQTSLWDEKDHPRDDDGTFTDKEGGGSKGKGAKPKPKEDRPADLAGQKNFVTGETAKGEEKKAAPPPPPPRLPEKGRQAALFTGLDLAPGQQDLFSTDYRPSEVKPSNPLPEKTYLPSFKAGAKETPHGFPGVSTQLARNGKLAVSLPSEDAKWMEEGEWIDTADGLFQITGVGLRFLDGNEKRNYVYLDEDTGVRSSADRLDGESKHGSKGADATAEKPTEAKPATPAAAEAKGGKNLEAAGKLIQQSGKKLPPKDQMAAHLGQTVTREEAETIFQHAGFDPISSIVLAGDLAEKGDAISVASLAFHARSHIWSEDRTGRLKQAVQDAGDATALEFAKEGSDVRFLVHPAAHADHKGEWQITRFDDHGASGHQYWKTKEEAIGSAIGAHPKGPYWDDGDADYRIVDRAGGPEQSIVDQPELEQPKPRPRHADAGQSMMFETRNQPTMFRRMGVIERFRRRAKSRELAAELTKAFASKGWPASV